MAKPRLEIHYEGDRLRRLVGKGDWRDPLAGLREFGLLSRALEKGTRDTVLRCRRAGRSWAEIGEALEMSKQSAWERFAAGTEPPE